MNAALKFGDHLLMASDVFDIDNFGAYACASTSPPPISRPGRAGLRALADGGKVEMAMGGDSWAPRFGVTVDRFGTPWMVNGEAAPEE
jgi:PhnB protein